MDIIKAFKIRLGQLKSIILITILFLPSLFVKKKTWVICERGKDARDNGYFFYKYIKDNHSDLSVKYIIDKNSADYENVKVDAVQFGSLKNYWIVLTAKKIISSHYALVIPNIAGKPWRLIRFAGLQKKYYLLQHGVTLNNVLGLYKGNAPMKLFICGAKPEYEYVKKNFGHNDGVVQYTGLARYDNLHDIEIKRQILVMPTWRQFIQTREEFLSSKYFKFWGDLLTDQRLEQVLLEQNCELIFYPHYEMQKYIDYFHSDSRSIKIAKFKDYDVQTLLKESALLITDYSSVFFDFAYMKKPLLYFQFDVEDFFSKHYQKGYFDYSLDGFGKVCVKNEELVLEIQNLLNNNFEMEDRYTERIERFFPLRDKNNCQRIYEKIVKD